MHYKGIQAGYELDNRLAANPNTRPEDLRTLFGRNQSGTNVWLARNPNTPGDVLQALGVPVADPEPGDLLREGFDL